MLLEARSSTYHGGIWLGLPFCLLPKESHFLLKGYDLKKLFKWFFPSISFMEGKQNLKKTSNLESIG
jgi:hypothetical protein